MAELVTYLNGDRVGVLVRKANGNLQFRYDADYIGPPISWSMPVQSEAHPHAGCLAVFGGLLLEGDGREVLARSLGVSAQNDYALLEELGGDVAGALTILPAEGLLPSAPLSRALDERELATLVEDLPQRPLAADPSLGIRLSLAGAQPKIPVILAGDQFSLPLNSAAPTSHIIKPEPFAFPGLVDNEAFCMDLAGAMGLSTASVTKRATAAGHPYLLVERYDRDQTEDPIRRLHQEDFCQALGYPSGRKYQAEGGPSFPECTALIREASAVPAQDLPAYWRALVFNWLIGNCDAHGKNYSLLYDKGAPTLAPLYDLVSTAIYDDLTRRMAMSIDGARVLAEVDEGAWSKLADQVALRQPFALGIVADFVQRVPVVARSLLGRDQHSNEAARAIAAGIEERASIVGGRVG